VVAVGACFALAAVAISIVEPMEGTFATELLPADRRGTGFGALAAVNGIGDFVSSAGVGALWQFAGPLVAFTAAGVVCIAGIGLVTPVAWKRVPE
jgi:hypothetical protein